MQQCVFSALQMQAGKKTTNLSYLNRAAWQLTCLENTLSHMKLCRSSHFLYRVVKGVRAAAAWGQKGTEGHWWLQALSQACHNHSNTATGLVASNQRGGWESRAAGRAERSSEPCKGFLFVCCLHSAAICASAPAAGTAPWAVLCAGDGGSEGGWVLSCCTCTHNENITADPNLSILHMAELARQVKEIQHCTHWVS